MLEEIPHFISSLTPSKIGSLATVGLKVLDPTSLLLGLAPQEIASEKDIYGFLVKKLKVHWATRADFDEVYFKAICRIVAGSLDPRPTH